MRDASHYAHLGIDVADDQIAAFVAGQWATVPLDPSARTGGAAVAVYANHGRWVVTCPDCRGALLAHPADRRFLCVDCGNKAVGGLYRPVVWPKDHKKIAELLDARPVELANWNPGETVADLRAENKLLEQAPVLIEAPPEVCAPGEHAWPEQLPDDDDAAECSRCHQTLRAGDVRAAREAAA